ncbi:MAG: hypothetical protein HGB12_17445, partial [Bacteroidetes bacterium]|nr:hypothetical protein [Bacteroidota bacterium]
MKTKMIKLSKCAFCIYFTVICSLFTFKSFSQGVAINTNGGVANNSAVLDLNVTNQGLLIPRITTNERASIIGTNGEAGATPATGLIIYNTDCNELQYYNGTTWISLINTLSLVAPVAITGSGATGNQITANWNSSTGATHYHLDVSTSSSFANFVTGYNNQDVSNVTSSNVTGLSGVTTYYYRVRAEN